MKGYPSSRAIIAGKQRITSQSVRNLISWNQPGEGILRSTIAADDEQLTEEVVARIYDDGTPYFLVQSEKFPSRYHIVHEDASGWHVFGETKRCVIDRFAAKVEAFRAEPAVEEVVEVAEGVNNVNALMNGPVEEVVEVAAASDAPMSPAERVALERKEASERVRLKVRIMEVRFRQANAARKEAA